LACQKGFASPAAWRGVIGDRYRRQTAYNAAYAEERRCAWRAFPRRGASMARQRLRQKPVSLGARSGGQGNICRLAGRSRRDIRWRRQHVTLNAATASLSCISAVTASALGGDRR